MLDEDDITILKHLRMNARKSLADISRETGISLTTVFNRTRRLKKSCILKFASIPDYTFIGYPIRVNFAAKAGKTNELREFLIKNRNVNSAFKINRNFDFYFEAIFSDVRELYSFTEKLKDFNLKALKEYPVVEELKKEDFFSIALD